MDGSASLSRDGGRKECGLVRYGWMNMKERVKEDKRVSESVGVFKWECQWADEWSDE